MSALFPEQPILFYPSLAKLYGTEEAVLLAIYHEFARHHGAESSDCSLSFLARRREWHQLASFWDEDRLAEITNSLVSQGVIDAEFNSNGSIRITIPNAGGHDRAESLSSQSINEPNVTESERDDLEESDSKLLSAEVAVQPQAPSQKPVADISRDLSVGSERHPDLPAPSKAYQAVRQTHQDASSYGGTPSFEQRGNYYVKGQKLEGQDIQGQSVNSLNIQDQTAGSMLERGPAPSFGGSVGWSRPKDDLEHLFDQHEKRNQKLHEIDMDWRPSPTTYQMLQRKNISAEFANTLIDEFIAYWMPQEKKRASWDPSFIKLAHREWAKEQNRQGRLARQEQNNHDKVDTIEVSGERYQSNNRAEKRERITEAVMDINNIDW